MLLVRLPSCTLERATIPAVVHSGGGGSATNLSKHNLQPCCHLLTSHTRSATLALAADSQQYAVTVHGDGQPSQSGKEC